MNTPLVVKITRIPVRYANSGKYPDHRTTRSIPAARDSRFGEKNARCPSVRQPLDKREFDKEPKMPVVDEIQKFYTAETISGFHDVTTLAELHFFGRSSTVKLLSAKITRI